MQWQLRTRTLELGTRTQIMGIVNLTSDSFSDGGSYLSTDKAIEHGIALLDQGADLLDLGAESTRPGVQVGPTAAVSSEMEQARLLPAIEGILRERPASVLSVDTYKAATARAALAAGAEIINDVSGLLWDAEMASVCAQARCGVVLMHTRGVPAEWASQPPLPRSEVMSTVRQGLISSLQAAHSAGISDEAIVLDPGYGFGKRLDENFVLLAGQAELLALGRPLLVGLSRKSFLTRVFVDKTGDRNILPEALETASMAAMVAALLNGASIVRVHQVGLAAQAAAIADAVLKGKNLS